MQWGIWLICRIYVPLLSGDSEWLSVTHQARHRPILQSCHEWCSTPVSWVEWDPCYAGVDLLFKFMPVLFLRAGRRQASRSHCSPILGQQPRAPCPPSAPCCTAPRPWGVTARSSSCPQPSVLLAIPAPCLTAFMVLGCSGQRGHAAGHNWSNVRGNGVFTWCKLQVLHTAYHKIPIVGNDVWWTELSLDGLAELCYYFPHNVGLMS